MRRSVTQTVLATVMGLILAAPSVMAGETIKLGVAGPHSGDLASYGIPTIKRPSWLLLR